MWINRCYIILILTLLGCTAYSQENRSEIFVDFRVNSTQIETVYQNNGTRIPELLSFLHRIQADSTISIVNISFCGAASPEGSYELNKYLAKGRMESLEKLVRSKVEFPDSIISYDDSYIPWEYLATVVKESDISHKQEILSILADKPEVVDYHSGGSIDSRIPKLQKLDGGTVWNEMLRRFFSPMRNACVVFITYKQTTPPAETPKRVIVEAVPADSTEIPVPAQIQTDTIPRPAPSVEQWCRRLTVKTNALGWGLGISNLAVEIDLCKHWSFHLPIYYSGWNYFASTTKFRTHSVQPEVRYWFKADNDGCFTGAHFGMTYYNVATNSTYRVQDHNGTSPALGGGLAVGYRLPISKNRRWKMEFSLGAGAYEIHYDKFSNKSDGLLVRTVKKTYIGIDQATVSVAYAFGLKGGTR